MTMHPLWRPLHTGANAARQGQRIARRQTEPGPLRAHDPSWSADYAAVEQLVREAIGDDALTVRHVGSTAVDGLVAKPVIDVDLTVPDVDDESRYLPALERAGSRLIFRDEMAGDPHRHLTLAQPNTNLHVWNPGAAEPRRHALFVDWLRLNPADRERYAEAKLAAVENDGGGRLQRPQSDDRVRNLRACLPG
ncbi:GrpB family protein [Labedella populi]|uniref:GrpB family protein n=1 Tax=Labedella populi TaxID=2498850 RepID=A0A444QDX0_9MICO|nr:GrpB family protein [Labedella populi]RWZ67759.1 GrpB family protein [Labedella populi]